jgi:hypothetical protein
VPELVVQGSTITGARVHGVGDQLACDELRFLKY